MRRGNLLIEIGVALAVLTTMGAVVAGHARARHQARVVERRAAELEIAQSCCEALRRGLPLTLPTGWTQHRSQASVEWDLVEVVGPNGCRLATLLRRAP